MKQLTLSDFQFPESLTIERQVLSDAVFNVDLLPDIIPLVSSDMFYSEGARRVWDMMVQMYNKGEVIDIASLNARLGREFSQLVFSDNLVPGGGTTFFQHVSILRDTAARRNSYWFALKLLEASVKTDVTEDNIAVLIEGAGEEILTGSRETSSSLSKVVNEVAEELQKDAELRKLGRTSRIRTGFATLDWNIYQGWGPGQLIILAARPSVGKTAVMLQFAMSAATNNFPTQIFTLEMTRQELLKRMLFSTGLISPSELANVVTQWSDFEKAAAAVSNLPVHIDDKSRQLKDICAKIRRAHNRGECSIAFIDYLGLIRGTEREQRYREVADITGDLKDLAKDLGIPIILLCQLNRMITHENRAPELSDLRESGDIEQDADIVLMLEQTNEYTGENSPPNLNLWVRKNRQFKKDFKIKLKPNETYSKFYEITTDYD